MENPDGSSRESGGATDSSSSKSTVKLTEEQLARQRMQAYNQYQVAKGEEAWQVRQWRCHPRFHDFLESIWDVRTFGAGNISRRLSVLVKCIRSKPGQEPSGEEVPFQRDPQEHKPKWKQGGLVKNAVIEWERSAAASASGKKQAGSSADASDGEGRA